MRAQRTRRLSDQERVLRDVTERDYMDEIIEAAEWLGFIVYHVHDSRKDARGFPDVWCVGKPAGPNAGRLIVIETKTETGTVSTDQLVWLGALGHVLTVEAMVARPRDVDRVLAILQGR